MMPISIHALREEGDPVGPVDQAGGVISIHALREEGDLLPIPWATCANDFYPRPPRGGRPPVATSAADELLFLSTPSARRATDFHESQIFVIEISIHALREEGDLASLPLLQIQTYFYPRPPRGGRQEVSIV